MEGNRGSASRSVAWILIIATLLATTFASREFFVLFTKYFLVSDEGIEREHYCIV